MKMMAFARRNMREMMRDPLTMAFGAGFPVVLMLLFSLIQKNVPVPLYVPESLVPGMAVFSQSFLALFAAMLISKDRSGAFMLRMLTSPMHARDFILGYALPLMPMAVAQEVLCYLAAFVLGMRPAWCVVPAMLVQLPSALFFISLGLIFGSLLNDKQVGGICGALLTNLSAWLSGAWFDLSLVGGVFEKAARMLPFANGVMAGRCIMSGDFRGALVPLGISASYALVFGIAAVLIFRRRLRTS